MTPEVPVPESRNHIADLLPAYVNGTLDAQSAEHVHKHLQNCSACRLELATWEGIRNSVQMAVAAAPIPSATILKQVWTKIDAPAPVAKRQWSLGRQILHLWLVLKMQIPIIYKSIWIASALVILFGCGLTFFATFRLTSHIQDAEALLALFSTVTSAAGVAFIYGIEHDAGLEITLSTPTSMRIVMICRLLLVVGYNFVLSALASAIVALTHGAGFWAVVQLWLGPMLLLSSITLALSLLIGSWFAIMVALVLESVQALPVYFERHLPMLQLASPASWQTSPTILLLTLLFVVFAVLYAPRQPRLSS
jgi:hypothetical protein